MKKRLYIGRKIAIYLMSLCMLFPLYVTIIESFMSKKELQILHNVDLHQIDRKNERTKKFLKIPIIPEKMTLSSYNQALFKQPAFLTLLKNSLYITIPVVIGSIIISLLTAYGFTIWTFKYKELIYFIYILVMLMPLQATLVPNFIISKQLGIDQSYWAIILPGIFAPFGTFIMRQQMKSIPLSYFEAARMDGAREWQIFFKILLPQVRAGIATVAMLVFIEYWNVVEQVIIFIKDHYKEPLSVFLAGITGENIHVFFAISVIFMLLPILFLLFGQKYLEKGIEMSRL